MDPRALWRVQLLLECKEFTADSGRLVEVPCDNPDGLATAYVISYAGSGSELAFAEDAPAWFVDRVRRIDVDQAMTRTAEVAEQIGSGVASIDVLHCSTYCFDSPPVVPEAAIRQAGPEEYVAVVDGAPVARAASSRSNEHAAELWVETQPAYRRRGYAAAVSRSWAADVCGSGKVAFYSHLHDNQASAALAARLGVRPLFELVGLTVDH